MANYNPLSWQNEHALSNYPFTEAQEFQNLIVDASFVQFDNYLPTLNHISVAADRIHLSITFDYGTDSTTTYMKSTYTVGKQYNNLRLYTQDNSRYLGVLVFGEALSSLWQTAVGRKIYFKGSFVAESVRSIPSNDAVYSFDGNYGDLTLGRTSSDSSIFYNVSPELNSITFNAVRGHAISETSVKEGLRKINLVPPLNNNINLLSNDIIKIKSFNSASLTVDLVSGTSSTSFILPTLIS